mgnify:CR=1 FL=1
MKPTNHGELDDLPLIRRLYLPRIRGVLFQRQMCPATVIVDEIISKNSPQVILTNDDQMVDAVPAQGSNQPLRIGILPGRSWSRLHFLHAHVTHTACELVTVDAVAVTEEIPRGGVPWKRFQDLLCGPSRAGRISHVEMDDPSTLVSQNDENEEDPECHRGHREEIDGDQVPSVVAEERSPTLRWRLSVTDHVLGDGGLRDIDPKLEQFPVYPRCTPAWFGLRHPSDELTDVRGNGWSTLSVPTAFPSPILPEAFSVPSDNGLGLDDREYLGPIRPDPGQENPKESVALFQMRTFDRTLQDSVLLPQCEILEGKLSVGCQG